MNNWGPNTPQGSAPKSAKAGPSLLEIVENRLGILVKRQGDCNNRLQEQLGRLLGPTPPTVETPEKEAYGDGTIDRLMALLNRAEQSIMQLEIIVERTETL